MTSIHTLKHSETKLPKSRGVPLLFLGISPVSTSESPAVFSSPTKQAMAESLQILFIDGNDQDREYYVQRLKISSTVYAIFEAETGRQGLELYRSHSIDCLILELELPDMSGLEVLVNLAQSLRHPEVPVIILTRSNYLSLMELALLNGAYISLHKQIAAGDHLERAINQAVVAMPPDRKRGTFLNPLWGLTQSA